MSPGDPFAGAWLSEGQAWAQEAGDDARPAFRPAPVAHWNPDYCADIGLEIRADGVWLHQGERFARPALVRLFARLLRRDGPDAFFLVTPHEKISITVADAPFVIVSAERSGRGESADWILTTNVGESVRLGPTHELFLRPSRARAADPTEIRPYVMVRDGLEALLSRPVYYELAAHVTTDRAGVPGLASAGAFFPLGAADEPGPNA